MVSRKSKKNFNRKNKILTRKKQNGRNWGAKNFKKKTPKKKGSLTMRLKKKEKNKECTWKKCN